MQKWFPLIIALVFAILIATVAFLLFHKQTPSTLGVSTGNFQGGFRGRNLPNGASRIFGTIMSISDGRYTVQGRNGKQIIFTVSGNTQFNGAAEIIYKLIREWLVMVTKIVMAQ